MKTTLFLVAAVAAGAQTVTWNVVGGLDDMVDKYLTGIAKSQWEARATQVAALRTRASVEARQAYIREKLLAEIGGFPARTPLNARVTGTVEHADYKVEKLIFESQPHYYVTANVFVPVGGKPPYAAVLGTAGHSLEGKAYGLYQSVWVTLARRGFIVLAYDPPGQGERLEYLDAATGKSRMSGGGTGEHSASGIQCLLTGTNIARYFVWDGIRAVDYLLTRPDVDPKRIAVTGNSGGGTQSSYLAAFEPRLAAAAPSCYLTSWERLWKGPGPQDAEQDFVDFLKDGLDFPDFLIAFAPKPVQLAAATRDFFPIEGAKATFAEAHRVFELLGAGDRMGWFEFNDTHGWSKPRREATYRWLERWLRDRASSDSEPALQLDSPDTLRCTQTGQVATSFPDAETVQSLNAKLAEQMEARRQAVHGDSVSALLRARLRLAAGDHVPRVKQVEQIQRNGYVIRKLALETDPGITVPALAFVPAGGAVRKPAVLYIDPAGKGADAGEGGPIEALVRKGSLVLSIDPRGWGESAPPEHGREGYQAAYQMAMRALIVGTSMPGMQTADALGSVVYLRSLPEVAPAYISIIGKGKGGVPALFAAALDVRIRRVTLEAAPASYLELARSKAPGDILDIIAPGMLRDMDLPDIEKMLGNRCLRH